LILIVLGIQNRSDVFHILLNYKYIWHFSSTYSATSK